MGTGEGDELNRGDVIKHGEWVKNTKNLKICKIVLGWGIMKNMRFQHIMRYFYY